MGVFQFRRNEAIAADVADITVESLTGRSSIRIYHFFVSVKSYRNISIKSDQFVELSQDSFIVWSVESINHITSIYRTFLDISSKWWWVSSFVDHGSCHSKQAFHILRIGFSCWICSHFS